MAIVVQPLPFSSVIYPTGKSLLNFRNTSQAVRIKNISLNPSGKSPLRDLPVSPDERGGSRSSRTRGGMRWTRKFATDERKPSGRQRRVVPTPRRWCQVRGKQNFPRATVARKPGHRGERGISRRNHCAGKVGMPPLDLYARVRFFVQVCTRDRGCSAHPAFPAPSSLSRAANRRKARAHRAARTRERVSRVTLQRSSSSPAKADDPVFQRRRRYVSKAAAYWIPACAGDDVSERQLCISHAGGAMTTYYSSTPA